MSFKYLGQKQNMQTERDRERERERRDVRGGGRGDERIAGQTNKTALVHMDFPHVNQYSSPDLPVEQ